MYPYPETARNHIAELHHQAERDTVAIALRRARRARTDRSGASTRKGPGCLPPTVAGTPKSAPQGEERQHQHPRRISGTARVPFEFHSY